MRFHTASALSGLQMFIRPRSTRNSAVVVCLTISV